MGNTSEIPEPHPCVVSRNDDGSLEYDHEWTLKSDWAGDPGVINGTYSWCFLECENCGETKEATEAELDDAAGDWP